MNLGRKYECWLFYSILMLEGSWFSTHWEVPCSCCWHISTSWQWLEPIPETYPIDRNKLPSITSDIRGVVPRQSGKLGLVIWAKCHCFKIFFLMCFFCGDKSQPYAGDNNTNCLTAFLTIVWHSVCLIIVSIAHMGKLSLRKVLQWLSGCAPTILLASSGPLSLWLQLGHHPSLLCERLS